MPGSPRAATCFFERSPKASLRARVVAETVGTFLLLLSVVGAGLMAQRLATGSPLLGLAMSAAVIAGTLVSMIVALGAVSGGHFNPLITALQCLSGERSLGCTVAYIAAQMLGGVAAAGVAAPLLGYPATPSAQPAASLALVASEAIATSGLMVVVFGCSRSGRAETGPFAVGAWLASAIMATPSGSYANPAVTMAAIVAAGPVHLSAIRAVSFVLAEVGGALLSFGIISVIFPLPPGCPRLVEDAHVVSDTGEQQRNGPASPAKSAWLQRISGQR